VAVIVCVGMRREVAVASSWWADHIRKSEGASADTLAVADQFERALADVLTAHYATHWYPDDVLRGSGYRAIVYDHRIDTVLVTAAERIGLDRLQLERLLSSARWKILLVNPGSVKVQNVLLLTAHATVIWEYTNNKP